MGIARDLLQLDVFAADLLGEAVVQVQHPPLHGDFVMQLFAGALGKIVVPAEIEHLVHGLLVDEAGNVVQGAAVGRLEVGRLRLQEAEGTIMRLASERIS